MQTTDMASLYRYTIKAKRGISYIQNNKYSTSIRKVEKTINKQEKCNRPAYCNCLSFRKHVQYLCIIQVDWYKKYIAFYNYFETGLLS